MRRPDETLALALRPPYEAGKVGVLPLAGVCHGESALKLAVFAAGHCEHPDHPPEPTQETELATTPEPRREPLLLAFLKSRARDLRAEAAQSSTKLSHSAALEALAHQLGLSDWNTLSALARRQAARPFEVGDRVAGSYPGHQFDGKVAKALPPGGGGGQRIAVDFDQPIDVVRFPSFSSFRRRVSADVTADGETLERSSDVAPSDESVPRSRSPRAGLARQCDDRLECGGSF